MRDDTAYHLRQRVRQEYTWPSIFARRIEPLIADRFRTHEE
jgi:hypothetical protein